MSNPKNHHFLPQAYLRSFTIAESKKSQLHVFDLRQSKHFISSTRNVGSKSNFNRIERPGIDPNKLEKDLAKIEGLIATSLKNVCEKKSISDVSDLAAIINLISILAARNPRTRNTMSRIVSDVVRSTSKLMVATEDRWKSITSKADEINGKNPGDRIEYQEIKEFIESDEYKIAVNQNFTIEMEMKLIDPILKTCAARNWCLLQANVADGGFITADHPVCLIDISGRPPSIYGVGFGMTKTAVIFPVSDELVLLGTFEDPGPSRKLDIFGVSEINAIVINFCERQIISSSENFYFWHDNNIQNGHDVLLIKKN